MRAGNFTGITGFPSQDIAMWLTMGPIVDRTHQRLGASDAAIVQFRKQMLQAVQAFANGEPAIGTRDKCMPTAICAYQAIVPKTTDQRAHPAAYVWDGSRPALEASCST